MHKLLSLSLYSLTCTLALVQGAHFLENFSESNDISQWTEQSDTVRTVGKSKAALIIQQTQLFQRAILFTLLNPQPNGAAFAGIIKHANLDLGAYNKISLKTRGQGSYKGYKFTLREKRYNVSFCNFFQAPDDFQVVDLSFDDFKPYHEGKLIDNASVVLDRSKIVSYGLQAYGGVFRPTKQAGPATLEIDWIKAA